MCIHLMLVCVVRAFVPGYVWEACMAAPYGIPYQSAAHVLQERDQLKARARDEAAALEARKNKVTVTVDLLGRQVQPAVIKFCIHDLAG